MSDDLLDRAKSAMEGVTPGPWGAVASVPSEGYECYWLRAMVSYGAPLRGYKCIEIGAVNGPQSGEHASNARFIAASRSLVPEMISEIERLRAEVARMALADLHAEERRLGLE